MDVGWSIPSFNCHWRRHSKLIYHSGKCKRFHWTHTSKDWQSIKLTMSDMFKKIQGQLLQNSYTAMLLIEQFLIWINWKYLFMVLSEKKIKLKQNVAVHILFWFAWGWCGGTAFLLQGNSVASVNLLTPEIQWVSLHFNSLIFPWYVLSR